MGNTTYNRFRALESHANVYKVSQKVGEDNA
jgi:hypothetical protein